jgi:uncharacterized protein
MIKVGNFNRLQIISEVDFGFFLDAGEDGDDILLPFNSAPRNCEVGDWLDVFIYFDSEDRIIATTEKPHAYVGEFAFLRVIAVEKVGAFLDWGLQKDLLVPFSEQKLRLQVGRSCVVWVYQDNASGRIVASTRLDKFISKEPVLYEPGEEVKLLIARKTELGFKAIINNQHWGVLYHNEVFQTLKVGQRIRGYVQKIREDGKIDLSLNKVGFEKVDGIADDILRVLKKRGGFIPVTAKSSPDEIYQLFGVSKKNYKMALGALYKKRLVIIDSEGITLSDDSGES